MKFLIVFLFSLFTVQAAAFTPSVTQIAPLTLAVPTTRQAVSATSVKCTCAAINALAGNTGVIYVGDVGVTAANGFTLQKGDTIVLCSNNSGEFIDLAALYFDGATASDKIKVMCSIRAKIEVTSKGV